MGGPTFDGKRAAHPEQQTPCIRLWMAGSEAGHGEGGNLYYLNPKQP